MLRDYQQKTIDMLYEWFYKNESGNPCIVLPTGAGKSHVIAALTKDAIDKWPSTRVLMLTHVKELIEQNAEKMRQHWPNAPMGIYSNSVGSKILGEQITFAGIQSLVKVVSRVGFIDLVIIDECHLVSHKDEGNYRKVLNELKLINPRLRVIGLTATPYRLGHGLITDKPAIFDALIEPTSIEELISQGYLSMLRSKITKTRLSTEGVKKRGGEFISGELQKAVDTEDYNQSIVNEVIEIAEERKAWLFFCAGVDHAKHVADILNSKGIPTACITGELGKKEREKLINDFKSGKIRAVTNANVLTTGFDYPNIDLIVMMRPTLSAVLYMQMAGRGLRLKEHTDHCLVLDFAGVVSTHGPITNVVPPRKKGLKPGEAPIKICGKCGEIVHASLRVCPSCGLVFEVNEKPKPKLHNDDIMGIEPSVMIVSSWAWRQHTSKATGKEMIKVTYYGEISDKPIIEYVPIFNTGFARDLKLREIRSMIAQSKSKIDFKEIEAIQPTEINLMIEKLNSIRSPYSIDFKKDGKFHRVLTRSWNDEPTTAQTEVSNRVRRAKTA